MKHEYRIIETYGNHFDKCFALQQKDNCVVGGWKTELKSTKEDCKQALQCRLDRISKGLEPTIMEQKRAEQRLKAHLQTTKDRIKFKLFGIKPKFEPLPW